MTEWISKASVMRIIDDSPAYEDILNEKTYMAEQVDELPVKEPDRPHGEWIRKDYSDQMAWATCSICRKKEEQTYNESPDATEETMVICKPFCPNCGADMRKREGGKE